ncbi:Integrator complex subunit 11 [Cichlidogyrus casuarinus]|uniref:Integrator complex subunit 11 n=1 Tax=Cichlidogyrus casuarinus TaxID=1844966 RepID=A0ABD2QFY4_9PLAT
MSSIRVIPLGKHIYTLNLKIHYSCQGAGQDVGRSCILVTISGKNIMLDCGMHMGYNDDRRFPDFTYITQQKALREYLDCVIISHFHLDHCGALPYMTEMIGYDGPIYMTYPTKAICPILLEDYRKITVERRGEQNFFTNEMIHRCMKKVHLVHLNEVVKVDDQLQIQAFYAGHVLGAAMFLIRVGDQSFLYTGDYNMTPDRHLGAAYSPCCKPDLLITESTYATTIRDSKRSSEREFLEKVHHTVENGGKVLIPVFALGRAQELCILLETYWDRMNLNVPIYFTTGMAEKATNYYKLFISWTNQKIKETFVERNMFDFKHIKPLTPGVIDEPKPMVVFATPGMLHAGQSLFIFRKWASCEKNIKPFEVRMGVEYMSFSAHADARGIMQLIRHCCPQHVLLVHGEAAKMSFLKSRIERECELPCSFPANGEICHVPVKQHLSAYCPADLVQSKVLGLLQQKLPPSIMQGEEPKSATSFALMLEKKKFPRLIDPAELLNKLGISPMNYLQTMAHNFQSAAPHSILYNEEKLASRLMASIKTELN